MLVKIHKNPDGKTTVAVCDTELFGQKYEEGDLILDLTSEFYKGEERDAKEIGDILRNADCVNLVGEKAVKIGIEEDVIDEENVRKIDGIPYAQATIIHD